MSSSSEAGPSSSSSNPSTSSSSAYAPTVKRFEAILKDELAYQTLQYPTYEEVPSCMTLFDQYISAHALVPQLRNIYRHGEFKHRHEKWEDFKFCMSLKGESPESRKELWIKRRAEWWAGRRVSGSSEDVWEKRKVPLENFPPTEEITE